MITRNHMPRPVRWSRIFFGVAVGMLILVSAQIALAGTTFVDGKKVETCKGSTCNTDSGNGGNDAAPITINANPSATNQTTVTASPRASASSSAKSNSTSRSSSRSSATGGNATATGGQATASNGNQTTSVNISGSRAPDLGRMVPDVAAPGLATGGDDVCLGSMSGGLGLSGIGAMFGLTLVDEHCQTIKAVKLLTSMGRPQAAIRRACMDDKMRDALGDECPPPKETAPSSSSSFTH